MQTSLATGHTQSIAPFNSDFDRFRNEADRVLDRFFSEPRWLSSNELNGSRAEVWFPAIDVSESDGEVTVRAETPGVDAKDLEIAVSGHRLTIAGEKHTSSERAGEDFYHCERRFGSFRRTIDLPETVDADRISAEVENGVVTIRIAKKPDAKPRQIRVKPSSKHASVE